MYLFVGGRFGDEVADQRPSSYIKKLFDAMMVINPHGTLENGGTFDELRKIEEEAGRGQYQVVLWMPDVPNDKEKLVKGIKEMSPEVILVTSKNNYDKIIPFYEMVARALHVKANLFVEFTKADSLISAAVHDPLGNEFCRSTDIDKVALAWGKDKPSVDTPIQLLLYRYFMRIKYMIHSHTHINNVSFYQTEKPIPCGAVEEFHEIIKLCPQRDRTFAAINLTGHGSLVMAKDVSSLMDIKYVPRSKPGAPEVINT